MIDTHAHLHFPEFKKTRETIITDLLANNVTKVINIGTDLDTSLAALELADRYSFLSCSFGLHPSSATEWNKQLLDIFLSYLDKDQHNNRHKIVAIGEAGLDYYHNTISPADQLPAFQAQIQLAIDSSLPLVIHSRDAHQDVITQLKYFRPPQFVFHCFSGDTHLSQQILELGGFISVNATLTRPENKDIQEAVRTFPLDHIMLETDCPYLKPRNIKVKFNEPKLMSYTLHKLAKIKNLTDTDIDHQTTQTAENFFAI